MTTKKRLTRDEMIADLQRVASVVKGNIGIKEVSQHGLVTPQTLSNNFGSFNEAKIAAGLSVQGKGRPLMKFPVADLAAKVMADAGRALTPSEITREVLASRRATIVSDEPRKAIWVALNRNTDRFTKNTDGTYSLAA